MRIIGVLRGKNRVSKGIDSQSTPSYENWHTLKKGKGLLDFAVIKGLNVLQEAMVA